MNPTGTAARRDRTALREHPPPGVRSSRPLQSILSRTVPLTLLLSVVLALFATAAVADPPNLTGAWLWRTENPVKLTLKQDGTRLTGKIESGTSDQSWDVEGQVTDAGAATLTRFILVAELGSTPEPALSAVIRQRGAPDRPGFLRGQVRLQYDAGNDTMAGDYSRINPSYYSDSGRLVRIDDVWDAIEFRRGPPQPDLEVVSFTVTVDPAGETIGGKKPWQILAEIKNSGNQDLTERFGIALQKIGQYGTPRPEQDFRGVAYGSATHPPLAVGESATIEWRTDRPTPTGNRPNVTDQDLALRVFVDHQEQIAELVEDNNRKTLWKVLCTGGGSGPPTREQVLWAEVPETGGIGERPDYSQILSRISDPARQVLCFIKLEAQRRARSTTGTVAGSAFLRGLKGHFLKDYLAGPSAQAGLDAMNAIGANQGAPSVSTKLGAAQYVPRMVRDAHPGTPTWLYPATEFWTLPVLGRGSNIDKIPIIDVPFLVGDENRSLVEDSDFIRGGKNLSNVMHWATGVKYGNVPRDALRELFIGYELLHLEGWDQFGEDAINDLISEEEGRLLGRRLRAASITSEAGLVTALDETFREARAWVGAMLKLRQEELDNLILAETPTQSNMWWGTLRRSYVAPWRAGVSIKSLLASGKTVDEVSRSGLAEQLTQIYTLIYEVDEWERRNGESITLTPATRRIINGDYDSRFRAAPKPHGSEWELR